MDSLRPPPPYPWPHPSPQRSESAKARSTNKQRDEQRKAHILTVSALQLLNWKVEKAVEQNENKHHESQAAKINMTTVTGKKVTLHDQQSPATK